MAENGFAAFLPMQASCSAANPIRKISTKKPSLYEYSQRDSLTSIFLFRIKIKPALDFSRIDIYTVESISITKLIKDKEECFQIIRKFSLDGKDVIIIGKHPGFRTFSESGVLIEKDNLGNYYEEKYILNDFHLYELSELSSKAHFYIQVDDSFINELKRMEKL